MEGEQPASRWWHFLLVLAFAGVQTPVSLVNPFFWAQQVHWRWDSYLWPARPLFRYLAFGTFLWWLVIGLSGLALWRRRQKLRDVTVLLPLVLATALMYVVYNAICLRTNAADFAFIGNGSLNLPLSMCSRNPLGRRRGIGPPWGRVFSSGYGYSPLCSFRSCGSRRNGCGKVDGSGDVSGMSCCPSSSASRWP